MSGGSTTVADSAMHEPVLTRLRNALGTHMCSRSDDAASSIAGSALRRVRGNAPGTLLERLSQTVAP
jgi:hypothetical protein